MAFHMGTTVRSAEEDHWIKPKSRFTFTFIHLADTFIQSDLQMRTTEADKTNNRTTSKCCDPSQFNPTQYVSFFCNEIQMSYRSRRHTGWSNRDSHNGWAAKNMQ